MRTLKACLRPAVRLAREANVAVDMLLQRGQGPLVAFLPAYGCHGAARLRIYNMAAALGTLGWRRLILPPTLTLAARHRLLAWARPDILVMQGARHTLNRPNLYPGYSIIYDMDDADFHLPHLASAVERAVPQVACVLAGSTYIADWCRARGGRAEVVWTGAPVSNRAAPLQSARPPVVAWAQSTPVNYHDEAAWVLDVMRRVVAYCPAARLRLYDRRATDDLAFLKPFQAAGIKVEWLETALFSDYLASFDDVAVGLAPLSSDTPFSRGKAFGKVLAYLDRRVPVIASDVGEYSAFFDQSSGVVSNAPEVWAKAITALLENPLERQTMADTAYQHFKSRLSLESVTSETDTILRRYIT